MKLSLELAALRSPYCWRAATVVAGGIALSLELLASSASPLIEADPMPIRSTEALPSPAPPDTDAPFPAIEQRPLFHSDRAPWLPPSPPIVSVAHPAAPPAAAALPPPRAYRLTGLVISDNAKSALLQAPNGKIVRLTEGASLEGWTVREIGSRGLRLQAGGAMSDITFAKHP